MNRGLGAAIFAAGLLISGCSLAGDITPPPALATAQMASSAELQTPAPLIPPATQPDLAAGAVIYAEKCVACHGLQGLGDGELAEGLAFEPAPAIEPSRIAASFCIKCDPVLSGGTPCDASDTRRQRCDPPQVASSVGSRGEHSTDGRT